ncbi:hypothetical protein KFL_000360110 [Klebsormidium nitens]|uniref:Beta-1,3-glucosyltransferase n=1 Tax=Klebsormidium nitens TaxID=105231 RepID=A0A1Y1HM37_KLENI|nr:hypothetical protein KFL_000360110 [Klebsormidium nitens]|eukprot:GAQ79695.1 hypothetical protein KFL_000360110 [Klebsormidium nitens]
MDAATAPRAAPRERPFPLLVLTGLCILSLLSVVAGWLADRVRGPVKTSASCGRSVAGDEFTNAQPLKDAQAGGCPNIEDPTTLRHVSFELASSISTWPSRQELVKLWWRPGQTRGHVWIDKKEVKAKRHGIKQQRLSGSIGEHPEIKVGTLGSVLFELVIILDLLGPKVSEDVSRFASFPKARAHAVRIARVVVEAARLDLPGVRWFVMGDDDTIFCLENVVDLLSRYDHRAQLYIGSQSESQYANLKHGYGIAFGGGGFAVSAPLAAALRASMDACIKRYPELETSDMWVGACAAELGVSVTSERGFHQMDLYGVNGFLEALPTTPPLSLHHLPANPAVFPDMDQMGAIRRLVKGMAAAPALFLQQALCFDPTRNATLSVAWGYSVKVFAGIRCVRDLVRPARTFGIMAHGFGDNPANLAMDTRTPEPWATSQCGLPFVLHVDSVSQIDGQYVESTYSRHVASNQTECAAAIARLNRVRVIAEKTFRPKPGGLSRGSMTRRLCCHSMVYQEGTGEMQLELGQCKPGQTIATPVTDLGKLQVGPRN